MSERHDRLLIFGCLADDTQGVLAAVHLFANVIAELLTNLLYRVATVTAIRLNWTLQCSQMPIVGSGKFRTIRSLRSGMIQV